jgi:hypothetical protein
MEKYKLLVDVLSSLASLVAILTVLYSWWSSKRPELKISQFIVSPHRGGLRIYLRISNRKPYPIKVNSLTCYKKQSYSISKKKLMKPQLWPSLDMADKLFTIKDEIELSELGEFNKDVYIESNTFDPKKLLFSLHTSHGSLSLRCKNTYSFDKEFESYSDGEILLKDSRFSGYFIYILKYIKYISEKMLNIVGLVK